MFPFVKIGFIVIAILLSANVASAQQADEICSGFGLRPSFDEPGSKIPYVYGRMSVRGLDPTAKSPKITAVFLAKVSDHPDKKKFEKYIKDNPPQ